MILSNDFGGLYIFKNIRSPIIVGKVETLEITIILSTLKHNLPN